jgi:hypothetical protein
MTLEESVQHVVMTAIQEVSYHVHVSKTIQNQII